MKTGILISSSFALSLSFSSGCGQSKSDAEPDLNKQPGAFDGDGSLTGPNEVPSIPQADVRSRLLLGFSEEFARTAEEFRAASESLQQASVQYCTNYSPAELSAAQAAWQRVAGLWETLELRQIGPLKEAAGTLKFKLSSWPETLNTCRIDLEVMNAYNKGGLAQLSGISNRQGLGAIEYLLFESELKTSCAANNPRLEPWKALSDEAKRQARCAYLQPLVEDLSREAKRLGERKLYEELWIDPTAKQKALQELFENLFYADGELKNLKLAAPAGLDSKYCPNSPKPCLERQQYPYADFALPAIKGNIAALAGLYRGQGQEAPGFLALLEAEGGERGALLAEKTEAELRSLESLAAVEAKSLSELIGREGPATCTETSEHWFCQVDASLRRLASDLKREFTAILALKAAQSVQGDND